MLVIKDEYLWMDSAAIIEQFTTDELKEFYNELYKIISSEDPLREKLPQIIEKMLFNEKLRFPYITEALDHINNLVKEEVLFRFRENKL